MRLRSFPGFGMTIMQRYIIAAFAPKLFTSFALFAAIISLVELFGNLWRFLSLDARTLDILHYFALGLAPAAVNALPIAFMFAASYSLAELYAAGELPVMFGSGKSLAFLTTPLMCIAILGSCTSYLFEDHLAVAASRRRNELQRTMLHQQTTFSNTDITVISRAGTWVYRVGYYDDNATVLQNVVLVHRDDKGRPVEIIDAGSALWNGSSWTLRNVRYFMAQDSQTWTERAETELVIQELDEPPETFRSQNRDIREMNAAQLSRYAGILARAGLPAGAVLAESQRRLSFSMATVLVTLMSIGTVGWFRKNLLLASLLVSLISATVYYVTQMVGMLLARTGDIPPAVGAWLPPAFFALVSLILVARTRR